MENVIKVEPERAIERWALAMAQLRPMYDDVNEVADSRRKFARAIEELDEWFTPERLALGVKAVGSTQPYYIAYQAQDNRAIMMSYGRLCARIVSQGRIPQPLAVARLPLASRKLRIGFVSAHVHDHSVWIAIAKGWIQHLNPKQFEVHLFHVGAHSDHETAFARTYVENFVDAHRTLTEWSEAIANAQLDVLIYPEIGMDSLTTQLACQRLAPIQATSWGHPHTTGLPTIDLFLSAGQFEPVHAEVHYTEKLVRLPNLGVCVQAFSPLDTTIDLVALGLPAKEPLLLCPGSPFKYGPMHDEVWAALGARLLEHGGGRLVFFRSARSGMTEQLQRRLRLAFSRASVDFDRTVCLIPTLPRTQFYALMQRATLMLDTIGFSGFNTALQCLECGLPIVGYEGEFMRGRLASGLLHRIGLNEWVATTHTEFVDLAMRLVADRPLRLTVHQRIMEGSSVLFNDLKPVRALEDLLIDRVAQARCR